MRYSRIALAAIGVTLMALAVSAPALAATATVYGNDYFATEVGDFWGTGPIIQGSDLEFTWSSDRQLTLVVTGPSGIVESYSANNHGSDTIHISETGDYFMTWTNSGSLDATLTYSYDVNVMAPVEHALDAVFLTILIGAIAVVLVIAVIIVLIIRGNHEKRPAQPAAPQLQVSPSATVCPFCGTSINSMTVWCAKCGTKLR